MLKKLTTVAVLALFSVVIANAQGSLLGKGLSSEDIAAGLKDALNKGIQKGTDKLSAVDGFFKDAAVKILFPPEAVKMEKTLRNAGFGPQVDKAYLGYKPACQRCA